MLDCDEQFDPPLARETINEHPKATSRGAQMLKHEGAMFDLLLWGLAKLVVSKMTPVSAF